MSDTPSLSQSPTLPINTNVNDAQTLIVEPKLTWEETQKIIFEVVGNCNICYNRRWTGYNISMNKIVPCKCFLKFQRIMMERKKNETVQTV